MRRRARGRAGRSIQADLSQRGGARALWRDAIAWRERIDTVVVNAATMPETPLDGTDEQWDEGWERTLRVNVLEPGEPRARGRQPLRPQRRRRR